MPTPDAPQRQRGLACCTSLSDAPPPYLHECMEEAEPKQQLLELAGARAAVEKVGVIHLPEGEELK